MAVHARDSSEGNGEGEAAGRLPVMSFALATPTVGKVNLGVSAWNSKTKSPYAALYKICKDQSILIAGKYICNAQALRGQVAESDPDLRRPASGLFLQCRA